MQILLDDYGKDRDIVIKESLEPQGAVYTMSQNENTIIFDSEFQIKELIDALSFLIKDTIN